MLISSIEVRPLQKLPKGINIKFKKYFFQFEEPKKSLKHERFF